MPEPHDREPPGRPAEKDDPAWLGARLAEAEDQLAATRQVLSVLARSSSTQDDVFDAVVQNACRICRAQVAQIHVAEGDVFRLVWSHGAHPDFVEFSENHPLPRSRESLVAAVDDVRHRRDELGDVRRDERRAA